MTKAPPMPDAAISDSLVNDPQGGLPRLLEIMARLRDTETGCPWDIEQTFATIAPYTIEEAHEVADAIERGAWADLEGELGDLLLQVVYHAQIGAEAGHFDFASVTRAIADKMVARHPHVFGAESRDKTAEDQTRDWERIKAAERAGQAQGGVLDGVALGLPALMRAVKLQKRAARVGFDWPSTDQVLDKIVEEARELVEARDTMGEAERVEEFGDLMFVMANLARHLDIDPRGGVAECECQVYPTVQADRGRSCRDGQDPRSVRPGRDGRAVGCRETGRAQGLIVPDRPGTGRDAPLGSPLDRHRSERQWRRLPPPGRARPCVMP